jgi:hypothetical protein
MEPEQRGTSSVDTAALSAGVVAVVVALFITPGMYGIVNLIISLTLVLVIVAYVWPGTRRWLQSAAVGAAIGLASLPGIGFFGETARSRDAIAHIFSSSWECGEDKDPCTEQGVPRSRVGDQDLAVGWLVVAILVLAADRLSQRRRGLHRNWRAST